MLSFTLQINPALNYSQDHLRKKLVRYLYLQKRDPKFIDYFEKSAGFCMGFSVLVMYSIWLETHTEDQLNITRDDAVWLWNLLTNIATWEGEELPSLIDQAEYDRLLNYIEFYQNIDTYYPQGSFSLEKSFADSKNRTLHKEYSIAGLFSAEKLLRPINIFTGSETTTFFKEVFKKDKLILLSTHNHVVCLLYHGEFFYYYNANNIRGITTYHEKQLNDMVKQWYKDNGFTYVLDSPWQIQIYSFDTTPALYPTQKILLAASQPAKNVAYKNYGNHFDSLYLAARSGVSSHVNFI